MSFDAYAVTSAWGPHVTLQAGVVHVGRHWTTTTRRSVKAQSIARAGWASSSRTVGGRTVVTGGRARVLDGARPASVLSAPVDALLAGGAIVRMGAGQLPQVVGYAEAGRGVPPEFLPWGRVLLVTTLDAAAVIDAAGAVVSATGQWCAPTAAEPTPDLTRRAGPRRERSSVALPARVPPAVAALSAVDGRCWLGVETPLGSVALPARWLAATGTVEVASAAIGHLGARLPGPVCVTVDDSHSRRPDRKLGCMLRGTAEVGDTDGSTLQVELDLLRVTWWEGFTSGSVTVD